MGARTQGVDLGYTYATDVGLPIDTPLSTDRDASIGTQALGEGVAVDEPEVADAVPLHQKPRDPEVHNPPWILAPLLP